MWFGNGISFDNLEIKQTYTNGGQSEIIAYNSDIYLSTQTGAKNIKIDSNNDIYLTNSTHPGIKVLENGVTNGAGLSVELYWLSLIHI